MAQASVSFNHEGHVLERGDPLHKMEMSMGLLAWIGLDMIGWQIVVMVIISVLVGIKYARDLGKGDRDARTDRGEAFEKLQRDRWAEMAVVFILENVGSDKLMSYVHTIRRRTLKRADGTSKTKWYVFRDGGGPNHFSLKLDGSGWVHVNSGGYTDPVPPEEAPFDTKEEALAAYERWCESLAIRDLKDAAAKVAATPPIQKIKATELAAALVSPSYRVAERDGGQPRGPERGPETIFANYASFKEAAARPEITPGIGQGTTGAGGLVSLSGGTVGAAGQGGPVRNESAWAKVTALATASYPCPCSHRGRQCNKPIGHDGMHWHLDVGSWKNDQDPASYPSTNFALPLKAPCDQTHNGYRCEKDAGHEGDHIRRGGVRFKNDQNPAIKPFDGPYKPVENCYAVGDAILAQGEPGVIKGFVQKIGVSVQLDKLPKGPCLFYGFGGIKHDHRCWKLITTEGDTKGLRCGGGRTHAGPCS